MATVTPVNVGLADDDGLGDTIRVAHTKHRDNTDAINAELVALLTAMGIATSETDLGTFTGTLLDDNRTAKQLFQQVETLLDGINTLSTGYVPDNSGLPAAADDIELAIAKLHYLLNLLNEAQRFAGTWDASTASFPVTANGGLVAGQTVAAGYIFTVTAAGTVDGENFTVGDRLLAMTDGASTTTYAANWARLDSGVDFETVLAGLRADDGAGAPGVSGLGAQSDHKHPLDVIPELITADTTITLDPATGSGAQRLLILDSSGPVLTVQPTVGEQVNGVVDDTKVYDSGNSQVVAVDVAAGQWSVGLARSFGGTSARLGEFFFAKSGKTDAGLLAVVPGTVTGGATSYPKWAAMYPEFVSGADIVFPADVAGMFLRNLGGNAAIEGTAQADGTAVNGLRTFRTYVQSDWNGQSNNDFGKGSGSGVGAANNGVGMSSSDPETRPLNRGYQLYTVVDGYGDSFAAGTLVAEKARKRVATTAAFSHAAWTDIELGVGPLDQFEGRIIVQSTRGDIEIECPVDPSKIYYSGINAALNTAQARAIITAGGTAIRIAAGFDNVTAANGVLQDVFVYLPQFNAIRAEDAKLSTDHVEVVVTSGATSVDTFTTQGIYKGNGTFSLLGAPVGNFVWTVDVDVFGPHIKQTFLPRDAGTTVLGHHVRRSFDDGGTWTAWAGH